jgi:hypothetical protein
MPKIKGPNGVVFEVSEELAGSLLKNEGDYVIVKPVLGKPVTKK